MPRVPRKEELKRLQKEGVSCTYCKPNHNENEKRRCKKYTKSWKVKTKNKKQFNEPTTILSN